VTATEACGVGAPYLPLRKAIGWIGSPLPTVLIAGDGAFSSAPLPPSDSYHTSMRNILVGSLCMLGGSPATNM
jgi:hypothetical protein